MLKKNITHIGCFTSTHMSKSDSFLKKHCVELDFYLLLHDNFYIKMYFDTFTIKQCLDSFVGAFITASDQSEYSILIGQFGPSIVGYFPQAERC